MASAQAGQSPQFMLTPQQQNLLFRALTSNQPTAGNGKTGGSDKSTPNSLPQDALSMSPESLTTSPAMNIKTTPGQSSGVGTMHGIPNDSPLLDYDYDFGPDSSFDFDFANEASLIGDLPGADPATSSKSSSPENDSTDKRSLPNDDEDAESGGGKRRESEGKAPKKPGRKPLMNEPSSKRKAQNRAAQRAFRERKEQHLKDLETKVEELESASAQANNENSQLKTQIEKLTSELSEYKKKLSLMANDSRSSSLGKSGVPSASGINDVNFQFEFPKFGVLPGPPAQSQKQAEAQRASSYPSPHSSSNSNKHNSPESSNEQASPNPQQGRATTDTLSKDTLSKVRGSLSSGSFYDSNLFNNMSRTSLDSASFSLTGGNNTSSPSASSNCNSSGGPSSSCGTSPEPSTQSPHGFKPLDTLTTIGEEQPSVVSNTQTPFTQYGNIDFGNFDWLPPNGGQFDAQVFGGYREPQNDLLANPTFDDTFFNDAFDVDFTEPFHTAPNAGPPKKDLLAEIDSRKETEDTITSNGKLLTCNHIWEKLQTCPKVQSGDLDLDGLCTDLQKKAKCGGTGAVVDELDFQTIMTKYLGADGKNCSGSS